MSELLPPAQNRQIQKEAERIFHLQQVHQYQVARSTARERIVKLKRLHAAMLRHRVAIQEAMWEDFQKGPADVDISETICVTSEIRHAISNLRAWMADRTVPVRLPLLTSSAKIRYEPKGVCLIIGPWNFPFNLNLIPLVGAVAAGNCVIIKPSEHAPHSSALLYRILSACFPPEEVAVLEGGITTSQALLELPFNHIFYTGSTEVGKLVMAAAAKHLSSVTLELGGKSPVVVDESADLDRAASRLIWIKCMNAGQTCIAPDFILVHESVHDALVERMRRTIEAFYGDTPEARRDNPDLAHLIHRRHFDRSCHLLQDALDRGAEVVQGGYTHAETHYIDPTILTDVAPGSAIWEEEIFSPLLPVQRFKVLDEAIQLIRARPKPLALYIFSHSERNIARLINETRGGGVSINECALQFFNPDLPFGGHNYSGIGQYHGKFGFLEFSNQRGIARQNRFLATTEFFLPPYRGRLKAFLVDLVIKYL